MKLLLSALIVLTLFTACEGFKIISGTVTDATSGQPLEGAIISDINLVRDTTETLTTYNPDQRTRESIGQLTTDSLGQFQTVTGMIGMFFFGGPKTKLTVSKAGYLPQRLSQRNGPFEVRLVPTTQP